MAIRFPSAQISVTLTCDVAPEEPRSGAGWRGGRHNKAQDGSALSFTVVVYRVIGLVSQQPSRRHDEYKKKTYRYNQVLCGFTSNTVQQLNIYGLD